MSIVWRLTFVYSNIKSLRSDYSRVGSRMKGLLESKYHTPLLLKIPPMRRMTGDSAEGYDCHAYFCVNPKQDILGPHDQWVGHRRRGGSLVKAPFRAHFQVHWEGMSLTVDSA